MTRTIADGVLFDIDDTLVDTRGAFRQALQTVGELYLPHLFRQTQGGEAGGSPTDALLRHWRADPNGHYHAYTRGEVDHRTQRKARANAMHVLFGGPALDDDAYNQWDTHFEAAFVASWTAHEDAVPMVNLLIDLGLKVGAVTNAPVAYQQGKLAAVGLENLPVLVGTDTLGFGKPAPEVFLEGCTRLGTTPRRTIYVGDEPEVDALAAAHAGLWGVWLDRPGARRVPVDEQRLVHDRVRTMTKLTELMRLVPVGMRSLSDNRWFQMLEVR